MIKSTSVAIISGLVASVWAQSTPTNQLASQVSTSCANYLKRLDDSTELSECMTRLVDATAAFNPATDGEPSASEISSTLRTLCSAGCDENLLRTQLASFYTACQSDLVGANANKDLVTMYDVFYVISPLRNAVCSRNSSNNNYCVQEIQVVDSLDSTPSGAKAAPKAAGDVSEDGIQVLKETWQVAKDAWKYAEDAPYYEGIYRRQDDSADQSPWSLLPTPEDYRSSGLVYLFLQPDLPAAQLCTTCTKSILASYIKFEAATPYAMGLTNSPILGDQLQLWRNVTEKCGQEFSTDIMNIAGVQSPSNEGVANAQEGITNSASPLGVAKAVASIFGAGLTVAMML